VARRIQDFPMVLRREVLAQQADRCERQLAAHEPVEHQWKPSRGAGRLYARIRGVLRQVQDLRAVGKKRGTALAEIERSGVHLAEQRNEMTGGAAFAGRCACGLGEQGAIGEMLEIQIVRHAPV
jgi:hypothetical protein